MPHPAVVVAFSSQCGTTEAIAHAAAVGAVNAHALPRLRRVAEDRQPVPQECDEALRRMQKEYVPPTDADIAGALALMIVPTAGMTPMSDPWPSFIALLDRLESAGTLAGKGGGGVGAGGRETGGRVSSGLPRTA